MELSPEQKAQLEEQKEQCIFCQIISGKVPCKKVYEDKLLIGILDINPASQGHVLFMPKEHYPIMPIIPPETFKQMFSKVKEVDRCIKKAMLCKETSIFIANGGAAGQQSAHFMLHIIPRGGGDGLEAFDLKGKGISKEEQVEVTEKAGKILSAMLHKNLPMLGYTEAKEQPMQKVSKEQLMHIINTNVQLKQMILNSPDQFKAMIPQHPQLSQLFSDVNVDEIIEEVKKMSKPKEPGKLDVGGAIK